MAGGEQGAGSSGDGEALRILSALKVRESEADGIVERARREGERLERGAQEKADADFKKAIEEAHAHAALYLEKARLEAHKEAEKIREQGKKEADSISKAAQKRVPKAVELIVKDFLGGRDAQ